MAELSITVETHSPLVLHESRASTQFAPTLDYIPGSTLRGALAALYLRGNPARAQDPDFRQLFLENLVFYPDLLPAQNPGAPWRLTPATAWGCKRFGAEHKASVTDTLLRLELSAILREQGCSDWHAPLDDIAACPDCEKEYHVPAAVCPRDRLHAVYALQLDPTFMPGEVERVLRTGTAVDRATGAVASGMLFSQQALESGQRFSGCLWVADAILSQVENLLNQLKPEDQESQKPALHLGYGRSRGMGHVSLSYQQASSTSVTRLPERWRQLNRVVAKLWTHYNVEPPTQRYFSLTLLSHLAVLDDCGRPLLDTLKPVALGLPWAEWGERQLQAVAVPGWNAAWGLPKADTWALKRSSVWLGKVPPEHEEATLQRLIALETEGAGERRTEGLGRICACDEFHYIYTLKEV